MNAFMLAPRAGSVRAVTSLAWRLLLAGAAGALGFWPHLDPASAAPAVPLILEVDRTDDIFAANACATGAVDDCSLRGAIFRANLNPGSTIRLLLSTTYNVSDSVRGRLQVTSPMTITGVNNPMLPCLIGPCYAHIRAVTGWTARVMENQSELVLRSVSLRGGNEVMAAGGGLVNFGVARLETVLVLSNTALFDGGGVFNAGELHVLSSTLRGNATTSAAGDGGGLYNRWDGTAWLTDTLVHFNRAQNGGGVASEGALDLFATEVSDNAGRAAGGGLYVLSTTLAMTSSAVTSNTAAVSGGGLHALTSTVAISDSALRGNATISPAGKGGAAFFADGRLTLHTARVASNASMYGGGLHIQGADVLVELSEFSRNVAEGLLPAFVMTTGAGGAIHVAGPTAANPASTLRVERSRFEGNRSAGGGGALSLQMSVGVLTDTLFLANLAMSGGAAGVGLGSLALVRSAVVSNTAAGDDGGGLSGGFSSLRLQNTTVSGNSATGSGGGVLWDNGTFRALNATIAHNTADADADGEGDGGGIMIARGSAALSNTIVAGNADLSPVTKTVDCGGVIVSFGYNLFGTTAGCTITGTLTGNITASAVLAPLAPNGSPFSLSHLPLPGSPARDGGDPSGCTDGAGAPLLIDQRGQARPRDGNGDGVAVCDVGAVEATGAVLYLPMSRRAASSGW